MEGTVGPRPSVGWVGNSQFARIRKDLKFAYFEPNSQWPFQMCMMLNRTITANFWEYYGEGLPSSPVPSNLYPISKLVSVINSEFARCRNLRWLRSGHFHHLNLISRNGRFRDEKYWSRSQPKYYGWAFDNKNTWPEIQFLKIQFLPLKPAI